MTTDFKRAVAYIDLNILEKNLHNIQTFLGPSTKTLCVVKAEAYGHGAVEVSRRLEALKVDYLGVATVREGIDLRKNGIQLPILVMSGLMPWDDLAPVAEQDLSLVVYDADTLRRILYAGPSLNKPLNIHLKVDTGMGRLGFDAFDVKDLPDIARMVVSARNVVCEGLMSHFASSELRDEYGLQQIARFREARAALERVGLNPAIAHMANSGAVVQYPEAHFNMVRTGINLYGSYSDRSLATKLSLRQVMKFVSRVALIREFPPGRALSYGRTYVTQKTTKVAYIPVGYADGYPRLLSNRGFVLINDRKCFIVGIICMDWFLVDITDDEYVSVGDEVILMGYGNTRAVTADELAQLTDTIPYEVLCKISKRVPRVYV